MYRELQPLRQALSCELRASLPAQGAGINQEQLLPSYLDRLTLYLGCDVADQTFTLYAQNASGEEVAYLCDLPNRTAGFQQAWDWMEELREKHHLRILLLAMETTGVYYWGWWDFLSGRPNLARVLFNARTTEHMAEVLSKKVRNDLVDAYALAEQVRLGGTPETVLSEDADLQTARFCSRFARDLAKQTNRKKNQLRSMLRAYNPVLEQVFPGNQLHHPAVYALLEKYVFPQEFVQAGVEALTTVLVAKCRTAFGEGQAWQLVELCRQQLTRPIGTPVIHERIHPLCEDIQTNRHRQKDFLKAGFQLIRDRQETRFLYRSIGAGLSNTLALVSEVGDVSRFPDGEHLASFLGITPSKHVSGTTLYHAKHITKQGPPNGRYAIVNLAQHLCRKVPKYQAMLKRIRAHKPEQFGYMIGVVAVARDFTTQVLYDMWHNHRPFYLEVEQYRKYRRNHPNSKP